MMETSDPQSTSAAEKLPTELIEKICEEMPRRLLPVCSRVSRKWAKAASYVLWSTHEFQIPSGKFSEALAKIAPENQGALLRRIKNARFQPDLYGAVEQHLEEFNSIIDQLDTLKRLHVWIYSSGGYHSSEDQAQLAKFSEILFAKLGPHLQHLQFSGHAAFLEDSVPTSLMAPSNSMTSLVLKAQRNCMIATTLIRNYPRLQKFTWEDWRNEYPPNRICDHVDTLLLAVGKLTELRVLDISTFFVDIPTPSKAVIKSKTLTAHNLTTLSLRRLLLWCDWSTVEKVVLQARKDQFAFLTRLDPLATLTTTSSLKHLECTNYQEKSQDLKPWKLPGWLLVQLAECNPNLETLHIASASMEGGIRVSLSRVTDEDIEAMASSLPNLEVLDIETESRSSSLSYKALRSVGVNCPKLKVLRLDPDLDITIPDFHAWIQDSHLQHTRPLFPSLRQITLRKFLRPQFSMDRSQDYSASPSEIQDMMAMLQEHFPRLGLMRRFQAGSKQEFFCHLKDTDLPLILKYATKFLDLGHFISPYYLYVNP